MVCFIITCYLIHPKGVTVKLGPFDGRVAAVHPSYPNHYISSPNYNFIYSPPGPICNVYARFDGRYGQDDHTQWLQPFSPKYPFLCCIPRRSNAGDNAVIWQDPDYHDFKSISRDGVSIGLGKWSDLLLESLGTSCRWMMDEVAQRRANDATLNAHPFLT